MQKEILRKLIIALKDMPQCTHFSDVENYVTSDFRREMERLLKKVDE